MESSINITHPTTALKAREFMSPMGLSEVSYARYLTSLTCLNTPSHVRGAMLTVA